MFGSGRFGRKGQGFGRKVVEDAPPEDDMSIHTHENVDDRKNQEVSLSKLKFCMDGIFAGILDDDSRMQFVDDYHPGKLQAAQVFEAGGTKQFSLLGQMVQPSSVDHEQHERLFWLANDLQKIQLYNSNPLARNQSAPNERMVLQNLKIAVNAAYLGSYCQLALDHCDQGLFQAYEDDPKAVLPLMEQLADEHDEVYRTKLRVISAYSETYATSLKDMEAIGKLPEIPALPVVQGHALDDAMLIDIYMDRKNGERMQNQLAKLQAWGHAENNGYFG